MPRTTSMASLDHLVLVVELVEDALPRHDERARLTGALRLPEVDHGANLVVGDKAALRALELAPGRGAWQHVVKPQQPLGARRVENGAAVDLARHGKGDARRKLALISPVITSVLGRCVASTRWMPVARAICASRQICRSMSPAGHHQVGQLVDDGTM